MKLKLKIKITPPSIHMYGQYLCFSCADRSLFSIHLTQINRINQIISNEVASRQREGKGLGIWLSIAIAIAIEYSAFFSVWASVRKYNKWEVRLKMSPLIKRLDSNLLLLLLVKRVFATSSGLYAQSLRNLSIMMTIIWRVNLKLLFCCRCRCQLTSVKDGSSSEKKAGWKV